MGGTVHTIEKRTESVFVDSKEISLQVTADKTKYMAMSRDQNAGRSHNKKDSKQFLGKSGSVQIFRNNFDKSKLYSGKIKSSLNSGNICYHSVQNLLYSSLLTKNVKLKIYRTIIVPVVCMGVKLGHSH